MKPSLKKHINAVSAARKMKQKVAKQKAKLERR
jgi:hypothetical protein